MALIQYTNLQDGNVASANDINSRFGDILAQVNGNLDAQNIRKGTLTRELFAGDAMLASWPVGSVYISVEEGVNPATLFGGSWVKFGEGKALVGVDPSDSNLNAAEKTFGSKTETLTTNQIPAHNHTGTTSGAGGHTHGYSVPRYAQLTHYGNYARVAWEGVVEDQRRTSQDGHHTHTFTTANRGGGQSHNNMQPSIAVYFWKRVG